MALDIISGQAANGALYSDVWYKFSWILHIAIIASKFVMIMIIIMIVNMLDFMW